MAKKEKVNYMLYGFYFNIKKNPRAHGTTVPEFFADMGPGLGFKEPLTGNECLFLSLM